MLEFKGHLTGKSLSFFQRRQRILGQKLLLFSFIGCFPIIYICGVLLRNPKSTMLLFYLVVLPLCFLFTFIPKSKKETLQMTPHRIYLENDTITCIAEKYVETKFWEDVKVVNDYGEFYELIFPFGNASDKFICQKSLLSNGKIEDFEKLFGEKIVKK